MQNNHSEHRYVSGPGIDKKDYVVPVERGGTNASSAPEARQELNVIGNSEKNQALGPLGLTSQGVAQVTAFSDGSTIQGRNSVSGPTSVAVGVSQAYTITDFDSLTGYMLERIGDAGSVTRNGATITYNTPGVPGSYGFKLNGRSYAIQVVTSKPLAPTILAPVNGATNVGEFTTMMTSAFAMNAGTDTHECTTWEIATNPEFTQVVASSYLDTVNKTSWIPQSLPESTLLYIRVAHKGAATGFGPYSYFNGQTRFTTADNFFPSTEKAILNHYSSANNISFGQSFDTNLNGEYTVVGSPTDTVGTGNGSAQVFKRYTGGSFSLLMSVNPSWSTAVGAGVSNFGRSTAFSPDGTLFAVGEQGTTNNGNMLDKGSISVYAKESSGSGFSLEQKLEHSGTVPSSAVSLCFSPDGRMLIGSYLTGSFATSVTGRVGIWTRNNGVWTPGNDLSPNEASPGFGSKIKISGDGLRLIVSASPLNNNQGAVYVFSRNTVASDNWSQEAKLVSTDPVNGDQLGYSIDVNFDGSKIVVGAPYKANGSTSAAGAVYVFQRTGITWAQEHKLVSPQPLTNGLFGQHVSMIPAGDVFCCVESNAVNAKTKLYKLIDNTWTFVKEFQPTTPGTGNVVSDVKLSTDVSTLLVGFRTYDVNSRFGAIFVFG